MAKVTLLPRNKQESTSVSSFTFQGVTFIAGETQEVSAQIGSIYMDDDNVQVEFTELDFEDLHPKVLERMAKKLNVDSKNVKSIVLPKKSVVSKVKSTLSRKTLEKQSVEEPTEELPTEE